MWTDLVQAYESKLAVLEEARRAYAAAVADVIGHVGPALEAAVRDGLASSGEDYRVEVVPANSDDDAAFASAPWFHVSVTDDSAGTEFWVSAWVASCWGGPECTLRVEVSLERVHSGLDRKEWVGRCATSIPEATPGELFDPLDSTRFADISVDWPVVRLVSFDLADRDVRQVAKEVNDAVVAWVGPLKAMLALIRDAGLALTLAEGALLRYRPTLEARAEEVEERVSPSRGLGGPWQGGKYLQIGAFWLATSPAHELLAAANKEDHEIVESLALQLERPTDRRGGCLAVVILDENQLRDPSSDIEAAVAGAFDFWFQAKAEGLAAPDDGGPA